MIFEKPILASKSIDVGGQTLTVYELTADVYYNEIIEESDVAMWQDQSQPDDAEPTPADTLHRIKDNNARALRYIAASLLPGYPDMDFAGVLAAVKANLSAKQVDDVYTAVKAVNWPSVDPENPKPATQAEPLSTDSPTT